MSESKLKPYADIKYKAREYTDKETGKTKGVWENVGTVFASPHLSNITIKLDAVPIGNNWNGWLSVFKREEFAGEVKPTESKDNNDSEVVI